MKMRIEWSPYRWRISAPESKRAKKVDSSQPFIELVTTCDLKRYVVKKGTQILNCQGEWVKSEANSYNVDDDHIAQTRFLTLEDAIKAYQDWVFIEDL